MKCAVEVTAEDAHLAGYGKYSVNILPNLLLPELNGVRLAVKLWLPGESVDHFKKNEIWKVYNSKTDDSRQKFPVVMEYLPYRKDDVTTKRDLLRHTWLSSHGFVVARVDMRGTGNSDGVLLDEYTEEELCDGCAVIEWLSRQPWSNSRVGVYGKSWGGFNGVQLAERAPLGLHAVISLYFTDDRYTTDAHYMGGCVVASEMMSWNTFMSAITALPPNPTWRSDWKELWKQRLESGSTPMVATWLRHQLRNEYWKHGSVCENTNGLKVPLLLIGGYRDGYRDAVFRLLGAKPPAEVCGLVGPWAHDWPDVTRPSPNMRFMDECLRWWKRHLMCDYENCEKPDQFRVYIQDALDGTGDAAAMASMSHRPGRWIKLSDGWPSCHVTDKSYLLGTDGLLTQEQPAQIEESQKVGQVNYTSKSGLHSGEWLSFGYLDGPLEQSSTNSCCAISTWTSPAIDKQGIILLGISKLRVVFSVKTEVNSLQLGAKLCDLSPNGSSHFVAHGLLNLCHNDDHSESSNLRANKIYSRELVMMATSYHFQADHRLQLVLSSSYWPLAWPSTSTATIQIHCGSTLVLPTIESQNVDKLACSDWTLQSPPSELPLIMIDSLSKTDPFSRGLVSDFVNSRTTNFIETKHVDAQLTYNGQGNTIFTDWRYKYEHELTEDKPLSAISRANQEIKWKHSASKNEVHVKLSCKMECTEKNFLLRSELTVKLNEEMFFEKEYKDSIERQNV